MYVRAYTSGTFDEKETILVKVIAKYLILACHWVLIMETQSGARAAQMFVTII